MLCRFCDSFKILLPGPLLSLVNIHTGLPHILRLSLTDLNNSGTEGRFSCQLFQQYTRILTGFCGVLEGMGSDWDSRSYLNTNTSTSSSFNRSRRHFFLTRTLPFSGPTPLDGPVPLEGVAERLMVQSKLSSVLCEPHRLSKLQ